jgi:DNA-binding CsgD family transcriptional regulator
MDPQEALVRSEREPQPEERLATTRPHLSPRQAGCLELAAAGLSSGEIGARLGISTRTVDQHIADACARLGVRRRTQAIARAARLGLICEEPGEF